MKTLATRFDKSGFEFEQVERSGDVAIYRKRRKHWAAGKYSFETIRVQKQRAGEFKGIVFEAKEAFPCSEQWGILAYTSMDLAGARARVATLIPSKS